MQGRKGLHGQRYSWESYFLFKCIVIDRWLSEEWEDKQMDKEQNLCWIVEEVVSIARDEILVAEVAFAHTVQRLFFQLWWKLC